MHSNAVNSLILSFVLFTVIYCFSEIPYLQLTRQTAPLLFGLSAFGGVLYLMYRSIH